MNKGLYGFPKGCGVEDPAVFPDLLEHDVDSKISHLPPTSVYDFSMWLDAADYSTLTVASNVVSQWNDKSGNSRNMTASGTAQPGYSTRRIGSFTVLDFDGSNDRMTATYNLPVRPWSYAAVVDIDTLGNRDLWGSTNGLADRSYSRVQTTGHAYVRATAQENSSLMGLQVNTPCFIAISADTGALTFRINEVYSFGFDGGTDAVNDGHALGNYAVGTEFYDGGLAEIMFWERLLTNDELDGLWEYFQEKWNLVGHI